MKMPFVLKEWASALSCALLFMLYWMKGGDPFGGIIRLQEQLPCWKGGCRLLVQFTPILS